MTPQILMARRISYLIVTATILVFVLLSVVEHVSRR